VLMSLLSADAGARFVVSLTFAPGPVRADHSVFAPSTTRATRGAAMKAKAVVRDIKA
jgi:hypothetical protein